KSIGSERTYGKLLRNEEDIKAEISKNVSRVADTLARYNKQGKVIVLKVRYSDFSTLTKRHSLDLATQDREQIEKEAYAIFAELEEESILGIRLLGVTVTDLEDVGASEMTLF
ncbi:DinB/UmuC family translesion DNA polymerase, partial [Streptococcus sobrinus]